ncbi:MAG: hypothetical protein AAF327_25395 [Cyanobacteria bacterium P01_A01_bin.37]
MVGQEVIHLLKQVTVLVLESNGQPGQRFSLKLLQTTHFMDSQRTATPISVEVPLGLMNQANRLMDAGWFGDLDEIVIDALRRFLESHREELMEDFIILNTLVQNYAL